MTEIFGAKYLGFIVGAYGITAFVLCSLVVWVLLTQRNRRAQLKALEFSGLRRGENDV